MNYTKAMFVGLLVTGSISVYADSPATQPEPGKPAQKELTQGSRGVTTLPSSKIIYVPRRGAPVERVGGGVRHGENLSVVVFAPLEEGLTLQAQPTLYWYLSLDTKQTVELKIRRDKDEKPFFTKTLNGESAGVHAFDLKLAKVTLDVGSEYEWSVDVLMDPKKQSSDAHTNGKIKRVEGDKDLVQSLASATASKQIEIAAANSLWYDAIGQLSHDIETNPGDSSLRLIRADLLRQVKIVTASEADEKAAGKKP